MTHFVGLADWDSEAFFARGKQRFRQVGRRADAGRSLTMVASSQLALSPSTCPQKQSDGTCLE